MRSLTDYCAKLQPGDTVPTHTELMRLLGVSERSVRWALDELRREGIIVRRNGAGTFIADAGTPAMAGRSSVPEDATERNTIIAISRPDRAVFDSAMALLCSQVENEGLGLSCQFIQDPASLRPVTGARPLGYILFGRHFFEFGRALQAAGHRVVVVGAPLVNEVANIPNVCGDHETGGALVMRHLLDLGHERIVTFGQDTISTTRRHKGHERAIREAQKRGKNVSNQILTYAEFDSWKNRPDLVRAYFSGPEAPTAVLAWNDHEAVALLGHFGRAGLRVPKDVSLVGYDNLREGQLVHPALTTVETSVEQQLRIALEVLTSETPVPENHSVLVVPHLIHRDSSVTVG